MAPGAIKGEQRRNLPSVADRRLPRKNAKTRQINAGGRAQNEIHLHSPRVTIPPHDEPLSLYLWNHAVSAGWRWLDRPVVRSGEDFWSGAPETALCYRQERHQRLRHRSWPSAAKED